jgi:catechol 2,3-dioxygenase-like lactoylglutathione lyase family enzyme
VILAGVSYIDQWFPKKRRYRLPATKPSKPTIRDFRPFVICTPENFESTKSFYTDLGFKMLWDDGNSACEFATGFSEQRFLVTLHYDIEPPRHAMLHFWVEDAGAWCDYMRALNLEERYPSVAIMDPVVTEWGWLITYVVDPAGVKLHFAQPHSEANKEFFNAADWIS